MTFKILLLSATPTDTDRLRLDKEVREIQIAAERARSRGGFEIVHKCAVRPDDLRRALLDYRPQLVHFSGHGTGDGLVLENDSGKMQLVSAESLARLFKSFAQDVRCVFLNACFSEIQADAIGQHINYVIGMNQEMKDQAAIEFAVGFYDALLADRTIEDAFEIGLTSIDLENISASSIPILKIRKNLSAAANHSLIAQPNYEVKSVQADVDRSCSSAVIPREKSPMAGAETVSTVKNTSVILEEPEGQVSLNSIFYVERPPIEEDCYESILKPGTLIRVKAPRQMGKTSLMSRVLNYASQQGYQSVYLSFQSADARALKDLDLFLRWFCSNITHELNLSSKLSDYWKDDFLGSKDKCTNYLQRYILPEIKSPIALGLDEVDEVFKHEEVATDFFGLLRAWHERAKNNVLWQKLRLVITHSKEVYIPLDINQSPFNVGLPVELRVLTYFQVQDLVRRHGLDWGEGQIEQLMTLLGGHPYLARMALYQIARRRMTLEHLKQIAPTEEGPYSDHLRRHLLNLQETKDTDLLTAARQVMSADRPVDVGATEAFKLCSMGLVKLRGNEVIPLCDLYRQYFCDRLGVIA